MPPKAQANSFEMVTTDYTTLEVPVGSAAAYRGAPGWSRFKIINEVNFGASVPSIAEQGIKLIAGKGLLDVQVARAAHIAIVNTEGKIYFNQILSVGSQAIMLPAGVYIVSANGIPEKVVVE